MPVFVDAKGNKYKTAEDTSPEELKEPLSIIISLKSSIKWSKIAVEAQRIITHMQKNYVQIQRLQDENTTWKDYFNDLVEQFKALVPEAVLCYQKGPDIPKEEDNPPEDDKKTP